MENDIDIDIDMMRAHLMLQGWEPAYWSTTGYGLWNQLTAVRYNPVRIAKAAYCAVTHRIENPQYVDPPTTWDDLTPAFIKAAFDRSLEPYAS